MLRVGVIGVGRVAKMHMPGWVASPHAEVAAGADVNPETLKAWGEQYHVHKLYEDPEDLIRDPDIQVVDICTPNAYHAPLAVAALEAGKHVLCEKPLAPTPVEIRRIIAARDASRKLLMTAQHFRFRGASRALKAELTTGALGSVYHTRAWMLRRAQAPTRPGFILRKHSGGGACIDIGVHILDLALWMMGNPRPVAVTGVSRTELARQEGAFSLGRGPIPRELDVEEFAAAFVRFETGASLILEVSWMLHHDTEGEDMQLWLYGTRGGAHWPRCEIYSSNNATHQHYNRALKVTKDAMEPHALECVEFAQAVVDGAPSPVPAEHALQTITILDAVYRSQEKGGEVSVAG
jgi:predicted dehydrogenase